MAKVVRHHAQALPWVRGALTTAGAAWILGVMSFDPPAVAWLVAAAAGALMLGTPVAAILTLVIAMAVPLAAARLVLAVIFLVVALGALTYLARDHGAAFLIVLMSAVGVTLGPAWAAAVLAGYLFGAANGAVMAAAACIAIQATGIVLGADFIGVLATGGFPPSYLSFAGLPEPLLSFGWLPDAVAATGDEVTELGRTLAATGRIPLLVFQPLLWAAGAAVAGSLRGIPGSPQRLLKGALAVLAGLAVVGGGSAAALALLGPEQANGSLLGAFAGSFAVVLGGVALSELVFTPRLVCPPASAAPPSSMRAEDAEVDELLRLISVAEEELSTKHTTEATVMITDMKSFSAMTEEEGSFTSAKLVQRHRDLLLPVITAHKGSGKSTGGDGLVAAFTSSKQAVRAAIEMQRTLREHNVAHGDERSILVRIGIARGEVVLDSAGRPFIGVGLNLAARVMNLGDGGCIMVTRSVADSAKQVATCLHSHGEFTLKNIAEPVEVIEVLWDGEGTPHPPVRS